MPSNFRRLVAASVLTGLLLVPNAVGASATSPTNGIGLYFSAPFVQGPSYSGGDVSMETFDGFSVGTGECLGASAVGEITTT